MIKPGGIYQVTTGDKVQVECIGYGFPIPSVALHYPMDVNSSMTELVKRTGYLKLEFTASSQLSGNYSCISKNYLGESRGWIKVIGRFFTIN